jgi:arsenite methyltransferase
LKGLPDPIKNSIEAYTGCIAGATKKDEYIKTIQKAGFKDVQVPDEMNFPIDVLENDPIGKKVIEKLNMSIEDVKEIGKSIVSIRVQAKK